MFIKEQLKMLKEVTPNKHDWIVQIVFTHELQTIYGTKEYTSGICESYLNIVDMNNEYNWDKCDIVQVTIYTHVAIIPIMSINGMKLNEFIKILKEV